MTRTPSPAKLRAMATKKKPVSSPVKSAKGPPPKKGEPPGKLPAKAPATATPPPRLVLSPELKVAAGLDGLGDEDLAKEVNARLTRGKGRPRGTGPKRRGETTGFYLDLDVSAWAKAQGSVVVNQILRAAMEKAQTPTDG